MERSVYFDGSRADRYEEINQLLMLRSNRQQQLALGVFGPLGPSCSICPIEYSERKTMLLFS